MNSEEVSTFLKTQEFEPAKPNLFLIFQFNMKNKSIFLHKQGPTCLLSIKLSYCKFLDGMQMAKSTPVYSQDCLCFCQRNLMYNLVQLRIFTFLQGFFTNTQPSGVMYEVCSTSVTKISQEKAF